MNRDDVIRWAREAGLLTIGTADGSVAVYTWPKGITEELERFAALVAAAEREACAKVAEDQAQDEPYGHAKFRCFNIAADIRARGETK
jgi:hypothetical protein